MFFRACAANWATLEGVRAAERGEAPDERASIALYFAHVVAERLRPLLPPGGRVLDFGDRRGRVGLHLEAAGILVVRGQEAEGGGERARPYDGAYAEVHDWSVARAGARGLAEKLAPGAPLLVRLERRAAQSAAVVARDLGPDLLWTSAASLGFFVPPEEQSFWAERHPHAFAGLCALEGLVRARPGFRLAGREALLLGVRR